MNSIFATLPQFDVSQIERTDFVIKYSGAVKNVTAFSRAASGWIVVLCVNKSSFIKGRFSDIDTHNYQVTIDVNNTVPEELLVGEAYPLLDGYWGELVELVFDESINWKKTQFKPRDTVRYNPDGSIENVKDGWDHEHCRICSQNISTSEVDNQFGYVNQNDDWLCESCYQKYVSNKSLDFINLDQVF